MVFRTLGIYGIIFILLFQSGSTAIMHLWYRLDNASFEQAFCENKDKPEMHCHGSCMMKKISLAPKEKEDLGQMAVALQWRISDYVIAKNHCVLVQPTTHKYKFTLQDMEPFTILLINGFFHPPEMPSCRMEIAA